MEHIPSPKPAKYFDLALIFFLVVGVVINIILFVRRRTRTKSPAQRFAHAIFYDPDIDEATNALLKHLLTSVRCFEAPVQPGSGILAEPSYTTASSGHLHPPNFYTCSSCRGQAFPPRFFPVENSHWNPKPSADPCDPKRWLQAWKSVISDESKLRILTPTPRLRQLRDQISLVLRRGREFDIYADRSEGEMVVSHRAVVTHSHFEGSQFENVLRGFEMACYISQLCSDDPNVFAKLPRCIECECADLLSRWNKIQERFSSDEQTPADPAALVSEMMEILEDARNVGTATNQGAGRDLSKCHHLECFRQLKLVPFVEFIHQNDKACEKFALLLEKMFMMVGEQQFVKMIKEHDKECGEDAAAADYIKNKILLPSLKKRKRKEERDVFLTVIDALPKVTVN